MVIPVLLIYDLECVATLQSLQKCSTFMDVVMIVLFFLPYVKTIFAISRAVIY